MTTNTKEKSTTATLLQYRSDRLYIYAGLDGERVTNAAFLAGVLSYLKMFCEGEGITLDALIDYAKENDIITTREGREKPETVGEKILRECSLQALREALPAK